MIVINEAKQSDILTGFGKKKKIKRNAEKSIW